MEKGVLLTGGAGFIGSHVAVALINAGYRVYIVDNYANSSPDVLDRIERITGTPVYCTKMDVTDRVSLRNLFRCVSIESVIHLAGFKAVGESVADPLKYYRNNLEATMMLLDVMLEHGVKKLIFSSSATVYGSPEVVPIPETARTGCTNPYGWTKLMSEQMILDVCTAHPDFSAILLRYFNPVGAHPSGLIGESPSQPPTNLFPYICSVAAGEKDKLLIFGNDYPTPDGTGIRDYIHIEDLAAGHVSAMQYALEHTGSEIINLGAGQGYSVLDVIHTFERVNNVHVPYEIASRRPGDVAVCCAAPDKAERLLHWKAARSLPDMCRDAWRWTMTRTR